MCMSDEPLEAKPLGSKNSKNRKIAKTELGFENTVDLSKISYSSRTNAYLFFFELDLEQAHNSYLMNSLRN
jgi:hypothetical protein